MVNADSLSLPAVSLTHQRGYRLINSKYPPIFLFDDVADEDEFQCLFELQALTNPRLSAGIGNLSVLPLSEIPFGIPGCSYAVGPFTHVNPGGSRFSDGTFGVLYIADEMETAIAEVAYHQQGYWQAVEGFKFERLIMRGLLCTFKLDPAHTAMELPLTDAIYDPDSYAVSAQVGASLRSAGSEGIIYRSVRRAGAHCWALFTPRGVTGVRQCAHYEFIWNGKEISQIDWIKSTRHN